MLEVYGPPLIEYKGTGQIIYRDGLVLDLVSFHCIQLHNSQIYIHATYPQNLMLRAFLFYRSHGNPHNIKQVEGTLEDGRIFTTNGKTVWLNEARTSGPKAEMLLRIKEFEVTDPYRNNQNWNKTVFPLTNLEFQGTTYYKGMSDIKRKMLSLRVSNMDVALILEENYEEFRDRMLPTRESTVTSHLEFQFSTASTVERMDVAANLGTLLSLAKGTRVTWPYYQIIDNNKAVIHSYHRQTRWSKFSSTGIIKNFSNLEELKSFIEQAYDLYLERKRDYQLDKVIDSIVEAISDLVFAEVSGLNIVAAVDVLRARWAVHNGRDLIFEEKLFENKIQKLMKPFVREVVKAVIKNPKVIFSDLWKTMQVLPAPFPKEPTEDVRFEEMMQKAQELNRPPFKKVLLEMIEETHADSLGTKVDKFILSRNSLVHKGEFYTDQFLQELLDLYNFATKLILAFLDYKEE